jgi:hypothetical protein
MAKLPVKKPTPKKVPAKKPVARKKPVAKPAEPTALPKPAGGPIDKALDLVKWIDSPFKLATVIGLGVFGLAGYIIYEQQDKLVGSMLSRDTMPVLMDDQHVAGAGGLLMRDLRAEAVMIHSVDLGKNARTTKVVLSADGRYLPLEGRKGAFFSGSPARNRAAIAMLNGEVACEPFEASSDLGDWLISRNVTYLCRGAAPPDAGHMIGYVAVAFKQQPRDITAVKTRINQTARDIAK